MQPLCGVELAMAQRSPATDMPKAVSCGHARDEDGQACPPAAGTAPEMPQLSPRGKECGTGFHVAASAEDMRLELP